MPATKFFVVLRSPLGIVTNFTDVLCEDRKSTLIKLKICLAEQNKWMAGDLTPFLTVLKSYQNNLRDDSKRLCTMETS